MRGERHQMSSFNRYLSDQFEMVLSFDEFCVVACALGLVEFHEKAKVFDVVWRKNDFCDVQAHSKGGHVWLRGQVVEVDSGGAVKVRILRRSVQNCKANWIHPMHLMPCGTQCTSLKVNSLWTPTSEIEWAVHPPCHKLY